MNYLIGLEQNNDDYSWEIICCIIGPGNDQVNVKLEGNGLRDGVAGPGRICWLFAHGCAAAVAGREMCFYSKPLRRPNSLPTTNAVNQLSGVHRKDETLFSFLSFSLPQSPILKKTFKNCLLVTQLSVSGLRFSKYHMPLLSLSALMRANKLTSKLQNLWAQSCLRQSALLKVSSSVSHLIVRPSRCEDTHERANT